MTRQSQKCIEMLIHVDSSRFFPVRQLVAMKGHKMSQDVTRCHKMSQGNQFQQQFEVDFCILAGCDYLPTISKVQMLQNACDVIQNHARVRWIQ